MRPPTERDRCRAHLDILVEGFMRDDIPAFRDACEWLRNFADQKNIERGRVMCGRNYWSTPRQIEAVREKARRQGSPIHGPGSSS